MVKTHENFKSIVPSITKADDINKIISQLLELQVFYETIIPPQLKSSWSVEKFHNFSVDLSKIDRVYFNLYKTDKLGDYDHMYVLIFRMDYYSEQLYVEMVLHWVKNRIYAANGTIFVCLNPNSFFNIVLDKQMEIEKILNLLKEDDIFLSDIYDKNLNANNVQTLQNMSRNAPYENRHKKLKQDNVLPKRLVNLRVDYDDYIETYKYYPHK